MSSSQTTVTNRYLGSIYAAGALARKAQKFNARIRVFYEGQVVDAKSILEILTLNVPPGDSLEIKASGQDAPQAVALLSYLLETKDRSNG